ncbi:MAG TPA: CHAP domain-containing protein [Ktedonobacteraceae bacterium]|nr:CHAP domain-containing protein [Ktedonobacteraceae bacterium]
MSSSENYQKNSSEGLQIPGLVQNQESVEQVSFTVNPITPSPLPAPVTRQLDPESSPGLADCKTVKTPISQAGFGETSAAPGSTRALLLESQPVVTQALENMRSPSGTTALSNTTALRPPLVIRGNDTEGIRTIRPPQGRRHVIGIAAIVLLLVITGGTLFAVSPLGHEAGFNISFLGSGSSLIPGGNSGNLSLVAQQATATAIVHQQQDGYDPGANGSGPVVTGSPESWPLGECTYWANLRYHALTGYWVTWIGNAYQWAEGARLAGWNVSSSPHIPSIVVLMPGVEGAGGYGHVAVAEKLVNSTTVYASNMNWYASGGGWDIVSYYDFTAGPGVYFIWK